MGRFKRPRKTNMNSPLLARSLRITISQFDCEFGSDKPDELADALFADLHFSDIKVIAHPVFGIAGVVKFTYRGYLTRERLMDLLQMLDGKPVDDAEDEVS